MSQEDLIAARLRGRDAYTTAVQYDTDPNGANVVGRNPVFGEGPDYVAIEVRAATSRDVDDR